LLIGKALGEEDDNNFTGYYQFVNQFGWKGREYEQLIAPHHSIYIDKVRNIYVTDIGNNRIQKYSGNGNFILKWGV
jgi:hypothetical protein